MAKEGNPMEADLLGTVDQDLLDTQLVVPPSPAKRVRGEEPDMVASLQQTMIATLQNQLGPMQQTLLEIQQAQSSQGSRLVVVENQQRKQSEALEDLRQTHTKRMDQLAEEIVSLQKLGTPASSRPTSPTSPGYRAVGPPADHASFDLLIGGWKEGRSKESVETELAPILSEALQGDTKVRELILFGKRPTMGKIVLAFPMGSTDQQCRDLQFRARDSIKQNLPQGFRVTIDKPPHMRSISKAVGILSSFMSESLKMSQGSLVVSSWRSCKAFVGETKITGLHDSPQTLRSEQAYVVQDRENSVYVWVDLHALASVSQRTSGDVRILWDTWVGAQ